MAFDVDSERLFRSIEARQKVDRAAAERMAAAVVEALSKRLSAGEAEHVEGELPLRLRRLLHRLEAQSHFERRPGRHEDARITTAAEFLEHVAGRLRVSPLEARSIIRDVFDALRPMLSEKELSDVASQLSAEIRELWLGHPAPPPAQAPAVAPFRSPTSEEFWAELRESGVLGRVSERDAARVVLGKLLHRISWGEAKLVVEELPDDLSALLRPELGSPKMVPERFGRDDLIHSTAEAFHLDFAPADAIVRAVVAAFRPLVSDMRAAQISQQLPADLRELWERPGLPPLLPPEDVKDARLTEMLDELKRRLQCDEAFAWSALGEVTCALERRLSGGEARQMVDELPWRLMLILESCRPPNLAPAPPIGAGSFIQHVGSRLGIDQTRAEEVIRTVFDVVRRRLSEKEARDVSAALPAELKALWWNRPPRRVKPAPARALGEAPTVGKPRSLLQRAIRSIARRLAHPFGRPARA